VLDPGRTFAAFQTAGINFFTGVPDSLLKDFCAYVSDWASPSEHVIAANEGGAVAIAAGHYLATQRPALVYLQNSGLGNTLNPLISLADPAVYGIPMVLLIGWRGEPNRPDEPQHVKQGEVTFAILEAAGIPAVALPETEKDAFDTIDTAIERSISRSGPYAIVVRRGTFSQYIPAVPTTSTASMTREDAIVVIAGSLESDATIVATTGKASRELHEFRNRSGQSGAQDFLTVGSMGHASQIALGISLADPQRPVWVLDGDGALIMHLGALAAVGEYAGARFRHVVLNNRVHDSVGGQPTPTTHVDIQGLATAAGYRHAESVGGVTALTAALEHLKVSTGPSLLEVLVRPGARDDLGRPSSTPEDNKKQLMRFLSTP
jgi:phosphonopyruvate decarboxylase